MLIIERDHTTGAGDGFTVRAKEVGMGRGFKVRAADLKAVGLAVDHYFKGNHFSKDGGRRGCPLCSKRIAELGKTK